VPRGSPYGTQLWRRTRRSILHRHGYLCRLQGPKCTRIAETVHHLLPSSQFPERFYDPTNLVAACRPCNYSGGREVQLGNRTARQMVSHLEQIVEQQPAELEELRRELDAERNGQRSRPPRVPAIR
jgi:5-methylcytosine-specific restriction endonuclease McrA